MTRRSASVLLTAGLLAALLLAGGGPGRRRGPGRVEPGREVPGMKAERPSDWFFAQRAYPFGEVNLDAYRTEMARTLAMRREARAGVGGRPAVVTWVPEGPTNVGGRITALAIEPGDADVLYAGAASGGVLRSTDGGGSWTPLFDDQPTLSIGALALDPVNPGVIWVGTGEANGGGGSVTYGGFGVFRTSDGGGTWEGRGLEQTRYIGRMAVDPSNPDRVFVAALGTLFSTNPDRGVYRTTDAGLTWDRVLFVSDSTGAVDIVQDPIDTDVLYAAMWERVRRPDARHYGGPESALYKTTDGGDTWKRLAGGLPTGQPDVGRIGVTLSAADPSIVYAIYADDVGYFRGLYRSTDAGVTWNRTNDGVLGSLYNSYGWWFGALFADPAGPDVVYADGVPLYKTTDGGNSWFEVGSGNHVDHHAMAIDPSNPARVIEGNDGGIYVSTDAGNSWQKKPGLPITQFYAGEIDFQDPERLYGGTQDNGTVRTPSGGLADWELIYGGDGFTVRVDPSNPDVIYALYQYGGLAKSTDGGGWFDFAMNGVDFADRINWSMPYVFDPSDPNTLYLGTHRIYRTTDGAGLWQPISGDLTDGPGGGNLVYHTVTTIAVAPSDPDILYAGTDDGNLWVTVDGGGAWFDISTGLPDRWVTRVAVDPHDPLSAYVTFSGFRWDSPLAHVYATDDGGAHWTSVDAGLPEVPVNDIVIDPAASEILYIGTDVGVFRSTDAGGAWEGLFDGLPVVPVTDLVFHAPTRTLAAATYGRSMFAAAMPRPVRIDGNREPRVAGPVSLGQNRPNPFNPSTGIRFTLARAGRACLEVFDTRGRRVRSLLDGGRGPGEHEVVWDGRDDRGRPLPSGPYIYRLDVEGAGTIMRKMLLAR